MLTEKQHEIRRTGIGASEAATVMGIDPWKTKLELYLEKIGVIDQDEEKFGSLTYFGHLLEDSVAKAYEDFSGLKVRRSLMTLRHKQHDFMLCHLDRKIEGQRKILECKTTSSFAADKWGETGTDEVPFNYFIQVQHQMAVTGYDEADIAVIIGGNEFRCYTIARDEEVINKIINDEADFWHGNVLAQIAPEPSNKDDVKLLYARDRGISIEATDDILECAKQRNEMKKYADSFTIKQKEFEDKLSIYMLDASSLMYMGKEIVSWRADKNGKRTMRVKA